MADVVPTDAQRLNALRQASYEITVMGASSWTAGGKTWTSLNLPELEQLIERLEVKCARATRTGFGRTLEFGA